MTRRLGRPALVAHARKSIARGSKSFAAAALLFTPSVRERAWLLYAWCRRCDDLADGQDHGGAMAAVDDPQARLAHLRCLTHRALAGEETGDPAFDGLGLVASECAMPSGLVHDLIEGFALDAGGWRPATEAELMRYCYRVAGTVGCMMALVMGVRPDDHATLDRACDLGLAFQLANIARDIAEDHAAGRCYIPEAWLHELGVSSSALLEPVHRPQIAMIGRRLGGLAARYEASARRGTAALPFRSAWAVLAAAGIYGAIARKVARRGEEAWNGRTSVGKAGKMGWLLMGGVQALGRRWLWRDGAKREALWTRPR